MERQLPSSQNFLRNKPKSGSFGMLNRHTSHCVKCVPAVQLALYEQVLMYYGLVPLVCTGIII